MKKILGFIALVLLIVSLSRSTFAQTPAATDSAENKIVAEYVLPYPGILPDHPLFTLKALRDWIFERLITDPMRKSEFYILQSDKRLAMASAFMDQAKHEEAADSVTESKEFMRKAIDAVKGVRAGGAEIPGHILDRLERSVLKHIFLIEEFSARGETSYTAVFRASADAFRSLQSELSGLH